MSELLEGNCLNRLFKIILGYICGGEKEKDALSFLYQNGLAKKMNSSSKLQYLSMPVFTSQEVKLIHNALTTCRSLLTLSLTLIDDSANEDDEINPIGNKNPINSHYNTKNDLLDQILNSLTTYACQSIQNRHPWQNLHEIQIYMNKINKSYSLTYIPTILSSAIENNNIPNLTDIVIRSPPDTQYKILKPKFFNSNAVLDASKLLTAIINNKKVSPNLKVLELILPEKENYAKWIEALCHGDFPNLVRFHYHFPYLYEDDMHPFLSVIEPLRQLYSAISDKKLPALRFFVVEGYTAPEVAVTATKNKDLENYKEQIYDLIQKIAQALFEQTLPKLEE